jgi:hypothetical protein
MNVKSLTLKPIEAGRLAGELAIHVELSSGAWFVQAPLLAEEVFKYCLKHKTQLVLLAGLVEYRENADTAEFLQALSAQGIVPVLSCSGQVAPTWMSFIKFRIATIKTPQWLKYPITDLIYSPAGSPIEEPELDLELHAQASFYLDPSTYIKLSELLEYLRTSKIHWKILAKPAKAFMKDYSDTLGGLERESLLQQDPAQQKE